jgi:hypothetical protein
MNPDSPQPTSTSMQNPAPPAPAKPAAPAFNLMNLTVPNVNSFIVRFDHTSKKFWYKAPAGKWVCIDLKMLELQYQAKGWMLPASQQSSFAEFLRSVQDDGTVDYAGPLGGHKEGVVVQKQATILVTSSPNFIKAKKGNWDLLRGILERMFGPVQLPYVYAWIKLSLEMYHAQQWMAGQVMVLAGPANSGKNLFGCIVAQLFGGRNIGKPYDYMAGKTTFNADYMAADFCTIDDEVAHTDITARRAFGSKIKDFSVNDQRRIHDKHSKAMTVTVFQRLLITLNDVAERLQILPPMEADILDKIMLLQVYKHDMPRETRTAAERKAFEAEWTAELPAFVEFLESWVIPQDLMVSRSGIKSYHDPGLVSSLKQFAPDDRLMQLIDEVIFLPFPGKPSWKGKASALERELNGAKSPDVQRETRTLLPAMNSCGRSLARLAQEYPDRVIKHPGRSNTFEWEILRAPDDPVSDGMDVRKGGLSPEAAAFMEKVKACSKGKSDAADLPE